MTSVTLSNVKDALPSIRSDLLGRKWFELTTDKGEVSIFFGSNDAATDFFRFLAEMLKKELDAEKIRE